MPITRGATASPPPDVRAPASQEGALAHGNEKPPGHALPGTAPKRDPETADQFLKPRRPARLGLRESRAQAFRKDLSGTSPLRTAETPYRQAHPNTAAMGRHIRQITCILAMEPPG